MFQELRTAKLMAALFASLLVSSAAISAAVGPAYPAFDGGIASPLRA
jgi:hypothetical protein